MSCPSSPSSKKTPKVDALEGWLRWFTIEQQAEIQQAIERAVATTGFGSVTLTFGSGHYANLSWTVNIKPVKPA